MLDLGKESTIQAHGQTWIFGRLELRVIRGFRDWIREQIGDPFARVDRFFDKLPKEEQLTRIKAAEKVAEQLDRFTMTSPLAQEWLATEMGGAKLVQLLLQAKHPDVTEDQAFQIVMEKPEEVGEAIQAATGRMPGGNEKAPAAA